MHLLVSGGFLVGTRCMANTKKSPTLYNPPPHSGAKCTRNPPKMHQKNPQNVPENPPGRLFGTFRGGGFGYTSGGGVMVLGGEVYGTIQGVSSTHLGGFQYIRSGQFLGFF